MIVKDNVAFHDIPAELFPFTIKIFREDNGIKVWETTITEPCALAVPPVAKEQGTKVRATIEWANGEVDST